MGGGGGAGTKKEIKYCFLSNRRLQHPQDSEPSVYRCLLGNPRTLVLPLHAQQWGMNGGGG